MRGWRFGIVLALVGAVPIAAGWPGSARSDSTERALTGRDGLTAVFVPAGALDRPTRVTAETLAAERLPAAPAGSRLLGAGRFGPHGLRFAIPARITLALEELRPAGTSLHLLYLRGTTYQALDRPAVVNLDGRSASAEVEHFSIYAVAERLDGVEDGLAAWEEQAAKGNRPSDQWCDWARAELERAAGELAADRERWRQASQQPPPRENANRGVTAAWARRMRDWEDDLDKAEARLEELRGRLARLCPPPAADPAEKKAPGKPAEGEAPGTAGPPVAPPGDPTPVPPQPQPGAGPAPEPQPQPQPQHQPQPEPRPEPKPEPGPPQPGGGPAEPAAGP